MFFVDTHTHLFSEKFEDGYDTVVDRALAENVKLMMLPNINVRTVEGMMDLNKQYPKNCLPMLGLHPCDVTKDFQKDLEELETLFAEHTFYGVGETGLDLHWDKSTLSLQIESLIQHIELAKKFRLPIIIHARESYNELFEVFDDHNDENLSGIFHCFTGTEEQAEKIISYENFKLGIGGVVTFKNSGLPQTLKSVELKHLVLETDSPYLAPTPHRGKRNESSYLIYIASKLAEVYSVDIEVIAKTTTENALDIFNLNEEYAYS